MHGARPGRLGDRDTTSERRWARARAPIVVLLTGPPGTGKSTLAARAADDLGAAVFGWDWAMAALTDVRPIQEAFGQMPPLNVRHVGWSIVWSLATAQLRRGPSVVLDGVARDLEVAGTRKLASAEGATSVVVATWCSDEVLHRSRIEGRTRGIPHWHELEWTHVADAAAMWRAPGDVDLILDTVESLSDNAQRMLTLLHRSAPLS